MTITKKSIFSGVMASLALLLLYLAILTIFNSFSHALEQFRLFWPWMSVLVIGFGIQSGLFAFIHFQINPVRNGGTLNLAISPRKGDDIASQSSKKERISNGVKEQKIKGAAGKIGASAGISTGSMIACCSHHLVDVLPILGLSAVFLFLVKYQLWFILLGIASNIVGMVLMLEIIKKSSLYGQGGFLSKISRFNFKFLKIGAVAISVLALLVSFFLIKNSGAVAINKVNGNNPAFSPSPTGTSQNNNFLNLASKNNNEGALSIDVKPKNFAFGKEAQFEVSFNTHQGDLKIDFLKQAVLIDANEKEYSPLQWQGGSGGHHISGILVFPAIEKTSSIKLVISDLYEVQAREFSWDLE